MQLHGFNFQYDIFMLDSNTFMNASFRDFLKNDLVLAIDAHRKKTGKNYFVNIPKTVKEELEKLMNQQGSEILHKRTDAVNGYDALETLVTKGYARIIKSDFTGIANGFNDVAVLTMLMELRRHSDISVLTNDRDFATDLLYLNFLRSVKSNKKVRVFYVHDKNLQLKQWLLDEEERLAKRFPKELVKERSE